jgi:hypothetical protein
MAARRKQEETVDADEAGPGPEQPGQRQALWIVTRMEEIQEDPDMVMDARSLLGAMGSGAQKYLAFLLREGPKSHAEAMAHFKATENAIEKAAREVVDTLKRVVDDAG